MDALFHFLGLEPKDVVQYAFYGFLAYIGYKTNKHTKDNGVQAARNHDLMNSRLTDLIEAEKKASFIEGGNEERKNPTAPK